MTLSRADRSHLLAKIDGLLTAKYYDPAFNGHNWVQIVDQNREVILNADSNVAFEGAVNEMLGEMRSTGLGLLGPETRIAPRNSINASFCAVETPEEGPRWVFQDVLPGGVADRAGIKPGDALIEISGVDTKPPRTPEFLMNAKTSIVVSKTGSRRDIEVDLTTQRPKYKDNPYSEPRSAAAQMREGIAAVLKIGLFPGLIGIDFANAITALFTSKIKDARRLVIDLRGNPGGGIGGLRVMSYLTPARQPIGYSVDRVAVEHGYDPALLPRLNHIPRSKLELPWLVLKFWGKRSVVLETEGLGAKPFHGRTVLLVNEHTAGAAEMVAQFAQNNQLATIVGTHTPGQLVSRSAFKIGHGYRLVLPIAAYVGWNGERIEGKGIAPDVPVDWSYESALVGKDTQFERALEVVQNL